MTAASFVGFALVLLGASAMLSLLLHGGLAWGKRRLRALGPWAERRAAALTLLFPPLFGFGLTVILAVSSARVFVSGTDHCLDHPHHLHLCLAHGAAWASQPWAVVLLGFFATFVVVRVTQTIWAHVHAQLAAIRLKKLGHPIDGHEHTFLVPGDHKFAFTTGVLSPTVVLSEAAWDALDAAGRDALLAHEHAHIEHGDIWKRAVLGILGCFGVPGLTQRTLQLWELASERVCDREAARSVGKASVVADAILSIAKSPAHRPLPVGAVFAATHHVTSRIHSLFEKGPGGKKTARELAVALLIASLAAAVVTMLFADVLHHLLETIVG